MSLSDMFSNLYSISFVYELKEMLLILIAGSAEDLLHFIKMKIKTKAITAKHIIYFLIFDFGCLFSAATAPVSKENLLCSIVVPHLSQNFAPSFISFPQFLQNIRNILPHIKTRVPVLKYHHSIL